MFNPLSAFLVTTLVPAICLFSFTSEQEGQNNIFEAAFQGKWSSIKRNFLASYAIYWLCSYNYFPLQTSTWSRYLASNTQHLRTLCEDVTSLRLCCSVMRTNLLYVQNIVTMYTRTWLFKYSSYSTWDEPS
jgi:hypothetical protein